jgi:hypothetical protein
MKHAGTEVTATFPVRAWMTRSPKKGSVRIKHLRDFASFGGNLPLRHSAFDISYPKRYDRAVKIESTASYTNWINDLRDLQVSHA